MINLSAGCVHGGLVIVLVLCPSLVSVKEPKVEGGRLAFDLVDLDGHRVSSSDGIFAGRVVLVDLGELLEAAPGPDVAP